MDKSTLNALIAEAGAQGTQVGLVNVSDLFGAMVTLLYSIAPEYDKTATYAKDALVIYDGKLYAAKAAINTAEAWTAAHWEERTLAAAIALKKDAS